MAEIGAFLWGVIPWSVLGLLIWQSHRRRAGPLALARCVVGWGIGIWGVSQLLGLGHALAPGPLRLAWVAAFAGVAFYGWNQRAERPANGIDGGWLPREPGVRWLFGLAVPLLGLALVRAFVSPPNTVDVLSYHLPRQLLWLQQGSLDFYPTINDRENMMPPLAEVLGLQFLAITGDDRWANLVEWAAYLGSAWAVGILARLLGARRLLAAAAGVAVLLVPMSHHEASSGKNDLLAGFWMLCFAVELAWLVRRGLTRLRPRDGLWPALALSAAWLTKSTTMVIAPVLVLCAGVALVWPARAAFRRLFVPALLAIGVLLLCVAPFHLRNIAYYGTPLGLHRAEDGGAQANAACSPALGTSNLLRHATVHLLLPWPAWNETLLAGVRDAHRILGVDAEDRRTTLWTLSFDPVYHPDWESQAGAPGHFGVGVPLLILAAVLPGRRRARWCAVAVIIGAFGLVLVLKWQPWLARLHQGLFFAGIAAVAASWQPLMAKGWARVALGIVLVGLVGAWWPGRETDGRRLWGAHSLFSESRDANYFSRVDGVVKRVDGLARTVIVSGARSVIIPNVHDVAYPLMRALRVANPEIVFAEVPRRGAPALSAEALVLMECGQVQPLWREYAGRTDWRLVGVGLSSGGVYLPLAQVVARGGLDVLPTFAGWRLASGLQLAHVQTPAGPILPACIFTEDTAAIVLPPLPSGGELRCTLLGAPREQLRVGWKDEITGHDQPLTLSWQENSVAGHGFTLQLSAAMLPRRLYFQLPAGSRPVLTRLQLQDRLSSH
ncbi:MAG: hypothetical protein H2172_15660 [Opitutus sp.]|nr:hypothetical protein [Opitutus sp.]MCS6246072.1 hypothetical protein [Opitutus sp.]MCS6273712.1 hypothetical protein [Opitutus sp.]MCS6276201.1 hypothetical protein [Opitutus sp.]MCS6301295.1 hypothetical protein [Opitutus sp.]